MKLLRNLIGPLLAAIARRSERRHREQRALHQARLMLAGGTFRRV